MVSVDLRDPEQAAKAWEGPDLGSNPEVLERAYALPGVAAGWYWLRDHVNLSTRSPLLGHPRFVACDGLYQNSGDGLVVAFLNEGCIPGQEEAELLLQVGVSAYCYNLLPVAMLVAAAGGTLRAQVEVEASWLG